MFSRNDGSLSSFTSQGESSNCIRRSIAGYAAKVMPTDRAASEIDAMYIGQGGGLRQPGQVANPAKRAILERLREKHGYAR